MKNTKLFPVLFVGHGSPMNAIERNEFSSKWTEIGKTIPEPKAIVCISAHWQTSSTRITASMHPRTIHDFGGFPSELSGMMYPAPGDRDLAQYIISRVTGFSIYEDLEWGLDHGCWSVLTHMYPDANIPVLQLSLNDSLPEHEHYSLAKKLTFLREQNILILCSGNIVHNLRLLDWSKMNEAEFGYDWAIKVNDYIKQLITEGKADDLCHFHSLPVDVRRAIPDPDHFWPVLYALALKQPEETLEFFNDKLVMGSLSMTSFMIQ